METTEMFTKDELMNLKGLIQVATITGKDALTVALLQQKIDGLLAEKPTEKPTETKV